MKLLIRFALALVAIIGLMAWALSPLADNLIARWFQHDVETRSQLIFSSVRDTLTVLLRDNSRREIEILFDRIAEDELVLAVGWCSPLGQLQQASKSWPVTLGCPDQPVISNPNFHTESLMMGPLLVGAFPLTSNDAMLGDLLILHDMNFTAHRSLVAKLYLMGFLALLGVVIAAVMLLMAQLTLRRWIQSARQGPQSTAPAKVGAREGPQIVPEIGEIRQLIRDLNFSHHTSGGIRVDWSPDTLRQVLNNELPGVEILVVSNREPYIHNRSANGDITMQRPASGLVSALEPVMQACGGTWIAHGSGSADRETVDRNGRIAVPPENPVYNLRRVWLSDEEQEGYYYGLSNEGLWPLCHITFVRPIFREPDWEQYVAVNRKFAEAVVKEAKTAEPIVLVQDYHFALLPQMVRERLPNAVIITFWHIPWPNSEVFGICPWREQVLAGLLGSSIIGFHTQLHCNNFIEAADRFMESHIDREHSTISVAGHSTLVRPYPISIAWPPAPLQGMASVADCRSTVLTRYKLPPESLLAVGVERFDFTKGIPDRFRAVEILLEKHPEWIGRFVLLQIAAPTRSHIPAYQAIQKEAESVAAEINARFGKGDYQPIILVVQHHETAQVYELFRAANVCIVNSLHDGMNLVAKEFVAARDDERGVLILSTFAGASRELLEALIVNPFDSRATADAIDAALRMTPEQQGERMHLMREMVRENNVYLWAGRILLDASQILKHRRIESTIAEVNRAPEALPGPPPAAVRAAGHRAI